jgi:alpha-ketoglutarate-dependent taurine dioxygenase
MELIETPELVGLDLVDCDLSEPLSPDDTAMLQDAFRAHHLLRAVDQDLSPEDQVRVVSSFGTVASQWDDGLAYRILANEKGGYGRETELLWHSDFTFTPYPLDAISLYGVEVAPDVSSTRFATADPEVLPNDLRDRLRSLEALNAALPGGSYDIESEWPYISGERQHQEGDGHLFTLRSPAIATDPLSTSEYVNVTQMFGAGFQGLSYAESRALLDEVFDALYAPSAVFEHEWAVGDLVIWNNRMVQHARGPAPVGGPTRKLRRVVVHEQSKVLQEYLSREGQPVQGI